MSLATDIPAEDVHAERWREWQAANARSSRQAAARARVVFTVLLIAVVASLARQLLLR